MKLGKRLEIGLKNVASAVMRVISRAGPISPPSTINRVLFIRYGGIGDMILSLPVFRAARERHPLARIDVLCDRKNAGPVLGTGLVDHIYIYEKNPWKITQLVLALRRAHYDYIINLVVYPSFTFGNLAQLIGPHAVRVAGDQGRFSYFYNRLVDLPPKMEIHMLRRLFLLSADITGPQVKETPPPWAVYPPDVQQRGRLLFASVVDKLGIGLTGARIVAVNLTAGHRRREWPPASYAEFLRHALDSYHQRLNGWALFSDPGRPAETEQLARMLANDAVIMLPPQRDFRALMEFLRYCHALITPDTSFSHAASAMGTPVLNLMTEEKVITWAPIGVPHRIVISMNPESLAELPVEDVVKAFDDLMGLQEVRARNMHAM